MSRISFMLPPTFFTKPLWSIVPSKMVGWNRNTGTFFKSPRHCTSKPIFISNCGVNVFSSHHTLLIALLAPFSTAKLLMRCCYHLSLHTSIFEFLGTYVMWLPILRKNISLLLTDAVVSSLVIRLERKVGRCWTSTLTQFLCLTMSCLKKRCSHLLTFHQDRSLARPHLCLHLCFLLISGTGIIRVLIFRQREFSQVLLHLHLHLSCIPLSHLQFQLQTPISVMVNELKHPLVILGDYICHMARLLDDPSGSSTSTRYPLGNYVSCDIFSPAHTKFLAVVTTGVEPCHYYEVARDLSDGQPCERKFMLQSKQVPKPSRIFLQKGTHQLQMGLQN